ncbi:MAG TPA: hypothetical protein VMM60_09290, partial [Ilumatobacter sp.]|nr:hypothetical protein [Ilumatobacter sp.]
QFDHVAPGTSLSILAAHGPCEGVTLTGVEWPLANHQLDPLVGLGISNVTVDTTVTISVLHGVVTVFLAPLGEAPVVTSATTDATDTTDATGEARESSEG